MTPRDPGVPDFGDPVEAALHAIGSPDLGAGSGSAAALALAAAIECLALHVGLSERREDDPGRRAALERMQERIDDWRRTARAAFTDDGVRVSRMVDARRRRDDATADARRAAVEEEVRALEEASLGLLELVAVADGVSADAGRMLGGLGAGHVRAESETARTLAEAASSCVTEMLKANVEVLARHRDEYDLDRDVLDGLRLATHGYQPIACSVHDRLEDAATRRHRRRVRYRTPTGEVVEVHAFIENLWTRGGAEYARLDDGAVIRLDRIEAVEEIASLEEGLS